MPLMEFKVEHNRTPDDARARLRLAIEEARERFGSMIQRVAWSPGRDHVELFATGIVAELRVDGQHVHATIDIPFLGGLMGDKVAGTLKEIVQQQLEKK